MNAKLNRDFFAGGLPAAEHLEILLKFETLIAELSSRFINRLPDEVDGEIDEALRRICELLVIDLAVLWQCHGADLALLTPTHTSSAEESFKTLEPLRQELFPWVRQQMLNGRRVALSSLEELPAEAAIDRENARLLGIKSNLTLPLAVGGEPPIGALSLNTLLAERVWSYELVNRLQLVAQIFTNALARRRHDKRLQENEARLAAGAELARLAFYEVDFGENLIYIDERFRYLCGIPPEREQGLDVLAYWIDTGSIMCIRTSANACWRCAGNCTRVAWSGSRSSIASCIRRMARSGFSTWLASAGATAEVRQSIPTEFCAT